MAIWCSFVTFIARFFNKSTPSLPIPVTTRRSPQPKTTFARPTSASVRESIDPSPLKRPPSTVSSSSPSVPDPERIFHPPPSPFPTISLSSIFATPPHPALDIELVSQSQLSTPVVSPSHAASTSSFHTFPSRSPRTPSTPSSAVLVRLDRSTISPTTMSDGSLEVISLGDPPLSPAKVTDIGRLPSPWSPIGKLTSSDVWMSNNGALMCATGPVVDLTVSEHDSPPVRTAILSLSRIPSTSLYSSTSAFDAFGISVFVNLDGVGNQTEDVDTLDMPVTILESNQVWNEDRPTPVSQGPQTPRRRRDTHPSVTPHASSHGNRATKCLSTPMLKLDNVGVSHVRSATSISSMAYELRMGLFADGRSITAFENIISLLDQASPVSESVPSHGGETRVMVTG